MIAHIVSGDRRYVPCHRGEQEDLTWQGRPYRRMTAAELASLPTSAPPTPTQPVAVRTAPAVSSDPVLDFSAAVAKRMGRCDSLDARFSAIRSAARAKPQLYRDALSAANPGRPVASAPVAPTANQEMLVGGWQAVVAQGIAAGADPIRARFLARRRAPGLHAALLTVTGG